jgi:hypothetical protein
MPEHVVIATTKDLIKFKKLCGTAVSVRNIENCELHTFYRRHHKVTLCLFTV